MNCIKNCGNCCYSSLEIVDKNKVICDKDEELKLVNFDDERDCFKTIEKC